MSNVIEVDFPLEHAYRKSGIKDRSLLRDMIAEGYDPCKPGDFENYKQWIMFRDIIFSEVQEYKTFDDTFNVNWEPANYSDIEVSYDTDLSALFDDTDK